MSFILSTARGVFIATVGGGTVYGSVKSGVWSTDSSKSAGALQEIREEFKSARATALLQLERDKPETKRQVEQITKRYAKEENLGEQQFLKNTLVMKAAICNHPTQEAIQPSHLSNSWSFSMIESAKRRWNSVVYTVTSALINEQNQWDRLSSMTTGQVKRLRKYFESSPKEAPSSKE